MRFNREKLIIKGRPEQIGLIIGIINRIWNGCTSIGYGNSGSRVVIPKDYLKKNFSMKRPRWQKFLIIRKMKKKLRQKMENYQDKNIFYV